MKIWITRHGQTELNKRKRMQGLSNEPLNETGIFQAEEIGKMLDNVQFDAVYASPLQRAVKTASIIAKLSEKQIITDRRIIEVNFGKYERCSYFRMGIPMTLYWAFPELFPAPPSVETIRSMTERASSFLRELEDKDYENVLIVCHGGIIRALCGYLENRKNSIKWRPKPHNCEVRVYESNNGNHHFVKVLKTN